MYLLFSPSKQRFAHVASGNVLTPDTLAALPMPDEFDGTRVVFGEGCTVTRETLDAARIVFKQIPYQIEGV